MRAWIIAPPPSYLKLLEPLPEEATIIGAATEIYPFVQLFAASLSDFEKSAQNLMKHAAPNALVWIAYPKKTSGLESNLSRDILREAMSERGWNSVSIVAIDEVWSALRFRPTGATTSIRKQNPGKKNA